MENKPNNVHKLNTSKDPEFDALAKQALDKMEADKQKANPLTFTVQDRGVLLNHFTGLVMQRRVSVAVANIGSAAKVQKMMAENVALANAQILALEQFYNDAWRLATQPRHGEPDQGQGQDPSHG